MSSKPQTLVIFTPAFPKDENDSIWLPWLQLLVKALNNNYPFLKIIVFSFQSPDSDTAYMWHNNLVIPFNGMHKKKLPRFLMWFSIIRKLHEIKRKHNIVGIFSMWCHECAFIGKYASKLYALKHYCWLLGQDARKTNAVYIKKIKPLATELVASSDFLQQEFYRNYQIKPAHVIPHGIDISLFDPNFFIRDIDIIGVGGLSIIKQYDQFVEIVAELKKHFPSIKVMLCGDGEDKDRLKKVIEDMSLQNNIEMTGVLQHTPALRLMQRSKILLHPSSYEGFGIVCIEALYAGARVVSFCKPLNIEIENWHIVKTKEEMYETALHLLNDTHLESKAVLVRSINDTAKDVFDLFNK